jgi:hypothetical protein
MYQLPWLRMASLYLDRKPARLYRIVVGLYVLSLSAIGNRSCRERLCVGVRQCREVDITRPEATYKIFLKQGARSENLREIIFQQLTLRVK